MSFCPLYVFASYWLSLSTLFKLGIELEAPHLFIHLICYQICNDFFRVLKILVP